MRKAWRYITVVAVVALLAGNALAEPRERGNRPDREGRRGEMGEGRTGRPGGERGGPGRFLERMLETDVAEEVGLTDEQVKTLRKGLKQNKKREERLGDKLREAGKAQAELLMSDDEIDEEAIMKAVEKTGRIRTQMAKLRIQPIILLKKALTTDQLATARKMMRERMKDRRREMGKRREDGEKSKPGRRRWQQDDDE